jgi:hypothetical protein
MESVGGVSFLGVSFLGVSSLTAPPIPLPSLADAAYGAVWGAEPDENTRARLLRAALSAQGP